MKKLVFIGFVGLVVLAGCELPFTPSDIGPGKPVYVPPQIEGAKEINVLRAPNGYVARSARGLIAQSDPLIGECTEPGSVYMFYSDNALVQYIPLDGTYTMFSLACKGDVEVHNSLNPEEDWWDIVTVSMPGHVYDLSHDPVIPPLTVMFLDNDGQVVSDAGGTPGLFAASDAAEYATWCYADGRPKPTLTLTFEAFGANDGVHVLHMQLGGDGISIPAATFHY